MDIEVTEVVPGELDVSVDGKGRCRVLIPAGVGLAGASDTDLAAALVQVLLDAGRPLPAVIDVSRVFSSDPAVFEAVQRELEADA
ncbi:MAG: hypothetical protein EA388_07825 [Nitriliruptor sp.]|nr:MAG: hypothetical protein EA388_07825 [Nitriliruptor sp.]